MTASSTDREKKDVTRQCASTRLHAGLHDTLTHATACLEHVGADESSLAVLWPEEATGQLLFVLKHDASVKVWPLLSPPSNAPYFLGPYSRKVAGVLL